VAPGCYRVLIGRSSRDLQLSGTVAIGGVSCRGALASVPLVTVLPGGGTRCLNGRSIPVHLVGVRGSQVRQVTVFVNGHRRDVLHGHRSSVLVTLPRLTGGITRVRLVIGLGPGRSAVLTRSYRACAATHP
jgi:hypothetical protein